MNLPRTIVNSLSSSAFLAVLALSTNALRAEVIYAPDFDTYSRSFRLSEQGESASELWSTTDPYVASETAGQTDVLKLISGYSNPITTDNWAVLGGFQNPNEPGSFSPSVSRLFSNTVGVANNTLRFEVDFAILSGSPNRDDFSWSFRNSDQSTTFFRLGFIPDPLDNSLLDIRLFSGGPTANASAAIFYNSPYRLTIDVNLADATRDSVTVRITDEFNTTTTVLNDITVANNTASEVRRIAAQWDIKNPAVDSNLNPSQFGTNAMIFENYSVSAVPEPGTAVLLIGGLALLGVRRKRS